jgi:hypothetical protein
MDDKSPKHSATSLSEWCEILAGAAGLEPVAACVTGRRSSQLNYAPAFPIHCRHRAFLSVAYGFPNVPENAVTGKKVPALSASVGQPSRSSALLRVSQYTTPVSSAVAITTANWYQ